jgi:acyl-CoA thioesterase-1
MGTRPLSLWRFAAVLVLALMGTAITAAQERVALVFGDSLMAGYGLGPSEGFVPQLQAALGELGVTGWRLENGAVSGDTTQSGLDRLDWALGSAPDAVLLGLGANDMLQGIAPERVRNNLDAMIGRMEASGAEVMLFGMMANRGLGPDYVAQFDAIYPDLAQDYGLALDSFFLDGVVGDRALNLGDGVHPNAEGIARIVARVAPEVKAFLDSIE